MLKAKDEGSNGMVEREELGERPGMILKAIVEEHVRSGEPVGSKVLAEKYFQNISSATIRNVMAELETEGYIEKPHTSAGRVPSAFGYRYYVNKLMNGYSLTTAEQERLEGAAGGSSLVGLDQILKNASRTVSELTNYTALAIKPRNKRVTALSFKLLPMNNYGVLTVIQTSIGVVKSRFVETGFTVSEELAAKLENAMNEHLVGVATADVSVSHVKMMEERLGNASPILIPLMRAFMEEIGTLNGGELSIEGVDRLLQYPEYSSLEQVRGILGLLEKKDYILNVVSGAQLDAVNVFISPESDGNTMQGSSMIFKTITEKDRPVAAIGVLGPCRMDYSKVISTVEFLTDKVENAIRNGTAGELGAEASDGYNGAEL